MAKQTVERYEETELYRLRHSAAHVMAQAVVQLFAGDARVAIGPPIEDGFYYDFELPRTLTPDDLQAIETGMRRIVLGKHAFVRREVTAAEARAEFAAQPYKLELIDGLVSGVKGEAGERAGAAPAITF